MTHIYIYNIQADMGPGRIPVELQWLPLVTLVLLVFRLGHVLFRFHFHS